jgi:hypothetical protein
MMVEAVIVAASYPVYLAFFLAAAQLVVFLMVALWLQAKGMPKEKALEMVGRLIGKPSAMAGWHKLAEHTRCRAVLLLRVEL